MDFIVLTIVLVTLLTVTGVVTLPDLSAPREKLLICFSTWAIPLIMSIAAVSIDLIEPVGWNWCWISPARRGLRYALAQCWWLAIVFFTISAYTFMWYYVHCRCAQSFSFRQSGCVRYTLDETYVRIKSSGHEAVVPRRSTEAPHPTQPAALAKPNTEESDFLELTLPIQGLKRSIDGNPETNGLFTHPRHHGRIDSLRPRPLVTTKRTPPGPNYHNQCPKVTRSFDVSMAIGAPQLPPVVSPPSISVNSTGPNYHRQCPKVTRSYDVSVQSAENRGEYNSGPRYHDQSLEAANSSYVAANSDHSPLMDSSCSLPRVNPEPLSLYHGECPDASKASNVFSILTETHTDSSSETVPQLARGSGPRYHNQCPKVQRSFEVVTDRSKEKPQRSPGPHSFPKVHRSVEAVPSQAVHTNCRNQLKRTDTVLPSGSSDPATPSSPSPMLLRPDPCVNITTVTTPLCPPPSPTPGLPPPPWSPGAGSPRRRTFFLSRSTWSDSTSASKRGSTSGAGGRGGLELRGAAPRALLLPLAAYPLAYAVLSLPGVVQCIMEAPPASDARAMAAMLGTGQYVGLAHAVAFAVVEVLGRRRRRRATAAPREAGGMTKAPGVEEEGP